MEYVEPEELFRLGHNVNPTQIRLEAYRLAAMFLSTEPIAEISLAGRETGNGMIDGDTHWLDELRLSFFWDEMSRILSYTATQGRLYAAMQQSSPVWEAECGRLEEAPDKGHNVPIGAGPLAPETRPLTLREAFAKIIHAEVINPDVRAIRDRPLLFAPERINPTLYLYGRHMNGRAWRATLEVLEFVGLVRRAFQR